MTLIARLMLVAVCAIVIAASTSVFLLDYHAPWIAITVAVGTASLLAFTVLRRIMAPVRALFRALAGTVASYRDGDFAFGIAWEGASDLKELVQAHNLLGDVLREQRQRLVQRELLLDTMVNNTPVAMLLVNPAQRVVFANLAARRLLRDGRPLEGHSLEAILSNTLPTLREGILGGSSGLFSVQGKDDEEVYALSRQRFRLNGQWHELLLLRRMTEELRRQEVQTWKKVIRVISHELNNSLAPIASLAHSGQELLRRGQYERLPVALSTIEDRARHLETFVRGYARVAKLPAPRCEPVLLEEWIHSLHAQTPFQYQAPLPAIRVQMDRSQMDQAMLNLLKNAQESGSPPEDIAVRCACSEKEWCIEVLDRGNGMSSAVLEQALLPFYSTKRNGTGLGLALTREIVEAHSGHMTIKNRRYGGVRVMVCLPCTK